MLLFIADEPTPENERDGMIQRIKWIDDLFVGQQRTMLSVSYKSNFRRTVGKRTANLTVERLNMFLHFPRILRLALQSDAIYVHSCLHAFRILPLYFLSLRIITDIHGVVPEEFEMRGKPKLSRFFSLVERIVIRRSSAVVFVTNAMRRHFLRKYNTIPRSFIIPILSDDAPPMSQQRDTELIIYSGGTQRWQLVDEMLEALKAAPQPHKYLLLTGNPTTLEALVTEREIAHVHVSSVPRTELGKVYSKASLGFVLRDKSIVNEVACPTKLVEYLLHGVVPIVKCGNVGDFAELGYEYVAVDDFVHGLLPSAEDLDRMREKNRTVVGRLSIQAANEVRQLLDVCVKDSAQQSKAKNLD